jgi:hypothetical protein
MASAILVICSRAERRALDHATFGSLRSKVIMPQALGFLRRDHIALLRPTEHVADESPYGEFFLT